MPLVTIDFHNTLFTCDAWFRLEIQDLPVATLELLGTSGKLASANGNLPEQAVSIYREIRQEAVRSGIECDAVTSMVRVIDQLGLPVGHAVVDQAVQSVMYQTVAEARPLDGAIDLVNGLHQAGFHLAVVSSAAYHPFLEWCLDGHGMRDAFQHVVTSAACGIYKSDPAIYQYTLDLFDSRAGDAVHIGDSHRYDVTSACKVGLGTILLADTLDRTLDPAPDAIISNLGDAPRQIDKLLGHA